jgi:hypothetical protein
VTFLSQIPFEVVGVVVLVLGALMALWSASGLREAYRSIGDGGLWLEPSRRHGDRPEADEASS